MTGFNPFLLTYAANRDAREASAASLMLEPFCPAICKDRQSGIFHKKAAGHRRYSARAK
jgi:hypothetical protein